MKKPIAIFLILLLAALFIGLFGPSEEKGNSGNGETASGNAASAIRPAALDEMSGKSGGERAERPAPKEVPGRVRSLTAVIPTEEEKLGGDVKGFASKGRMQLGKGQSLLSGGYLDDEGRRVYMLMTPQLMDGGADQGVKMSCSVVALDPRQMGETGLDTLTSGSSGSEGVEFWSVDDAAALMEVISDEAYRSRPTMIARAGQSGSIEVRSPGVAEKLELTARPTNEGGFDLETGWAHEDDSLPADAVAEEPTR